MSSFATSRLGAHLFSVALRFTNSAQRWLSQLVPAPFRLIQTGNAYWHSRLLLLAVDLDIASELNHNALSLAQLAQRCACSEEYLQRLMNYLLAQQLFARNKQQQFVNNPASNYLNRHHQNNIRDMILLHQSPAMQNAWNKGLAQSFKQGTPAFEIANGKNLYDFLRGDEHSNALFNNAMTSVNALAGDYYARDFAWSRFNRVIDIGGSKGSKSANILTHHPKLKALVVDHQAVIDDVNTLALAESISQRMAFAVGDVFNELPDINADDVCLLSAVLHSYNDSDCIRALSNIRQQANCPQPWVVIAEMHVNEPIDSTAALLDIQMLVTCNGAERNLRQWRSIASRAGFDLIEVVATRSLAQLLLLRARGT